LEGLTYQHFRPNLVVGGGTAYQEDSWDAITIGDQLLNTIGACNRCTMVCINLNTATIGEEPLLTLSNYRRSKGRILFGQHFVHNPEDSSPPFSIQINTPVNVFKKLCI